jgi:hypothetical protein
VNQADSKHIPTSHLRPEFCMVYPEAISTSLARTVPVDHFILLAISKHLHIEVLSHLYGVQGRQGNCLLQFFR